MQLNPHHPGWYRFSAFQNAYRKKDYRAALEVALKFNMPSYFYTHAALAAAYGQLGEREAAGRALQELLTLKPDFAGVAREELAKWHGTSEVLEGWLDGLRKAGLDVGASSPERLGPNAAQRTAGVAIAVLPFSDMSPAKDQEYLCEGMAEEIMNALVRIEGIRVASRTSTFRASLQETDLAAVGRVLSVDHLLEGSVRTAGSRMRVTAELSDVASGYQLWSERYDREAEDVFAVQDEIAAGVVGAVKARLRSGEHALPARPQVENLAAYQQYLKGRHLRDTKNDHVAARRAFEEAVRLDPSHVPSWVGLAEARVLAAAYSLVPSAEARALAKKALATATECKGESAEGRFVEGMIAFSERDLAASERAARRALELRPDYVEARCWLGMLLCTLGRSEEARPHLQHAREADPLAPYPYAMSGVALMLVGRTPEAGGFLDQALAFGQENSLALWVSGLCRIA